MKSLLKKSWPFILLAALAIITHFAFLSYPAQVVFDEVHFGKFVAAYSTGQYYFDIHPPLGKLMIAGFAKLSNVDPVFAFDKIGEPIPENILLALRFLPAFFGALFVLIFSWLAWLISRSKKIALIAGLLVLLDNALLVQSKFILVDIFMLCFEVLTLGFFFLWQQQKKFSARWFGCLILTAIFAGLTISVKWTGVAIIGIVGTVLLVNIFSQKMREYLANPRITTSRHDNKIPGKQKEIGAGITKRIAGAILSFLVIVIIGFAVYITFFSIHFKLLPASGPGDAFMSQSFQQELKYGRANMYQPLSFWQKFTELNKTMFTANAGITAEHPFGSKWYNWPLNSKPVYYWNRNDANIQPNQQAKIFLSGNPALWWLAGFSVIFTLVIALTKKGRRRLEPIFYILLLGYFANLLPFIFISRVAFLYHYLPSLLCAVLILALWLGKLWNGRKTAAASIIALIAIAFILLSPVSYGWLLPQTSALETKIINLFN